MDEILAHTLLYDFYGELLTEHQRKIYEDVVFNDLSYIEVAKQEQISRQGVFDLMRRINKILTGYEEKLHLVEQFEKQRKIAARIRDLAGHYLDQQSGSDPEDIRRIHELAQEMLKLQ